MSADYDAVRPLEERLMNAWPALRTMMCDGWIFREAMGYTKRANSACALDARNGFAATLAEAERFYESFGAPTVFRLTPLAGALPDRILAEHGYGSMDETLVMTAPLQEAAAADPSIGIARDYSADWGQGHAAASGLGIRERRAHRAILDKIAPIPRAFAVSRDDKGAVAFGLGVIERGRLAIFDIVTAAAARRKGAARKLVGALMEWGAREGADAAWLSVLGGNSAAIALYRQLGFRELYRYHYRVAVQQEGLSLSSRDNVALSVYPE